ncbi:MAG: alpha-galactosidase [Verrucomicrobiota bacterium]|nr:alpha-galactosidase [Verrucomicrobiota bacterium]
MRTTPVLPITAILTLLIFSLESAQAVTPNPDNQNQGSEAVTADWLVEKIERPVTLTPVPERQELVLENGLIRRIWRLEPNAATVGFDLLATNTTYLRGVKPEAILTINGKRLTIGGLIGQPDYAYLRPDWIGQLENDPASFQFQRWETGPTQAPFEWAQVRHHAVDAQWPPPGRGVTLLFTPSKQHPELAGLKVEIHYEMYQGIPLIGKWFTLYNGQDQPITLDAFVAEQLAVVEPASHVEVPDRWQLPALHMESNYSFHGDSYWSANETTHWVPDPDYSTQVNYRRVAPVMLESKPPIGPDLLIQPGETFTSFRTFTLLFDSTERERRALAQRRMYRTLAPWVTENPTLMHVLAGDPAVIRNAIDQCAEVGVEMVILSFGSGFNMESEDPAYLDQIKALADYAHAKGIQIGGYSLLASRRINDQVDVIHPETGTTGGAIFGNSPCLCSTWGEEYFRKLKHFIEYTGIDCLEHDGSYPGDLCASTQHADHRGLQDSQWKQWARIREFYQWCRARGVYLNVPDWYFLSGSNKTGMGYREVNWSLPRERQIILARQNIFDGTWEKSPTMGWMFVPLVQYHGGGEAATLEPLSEHLDAYEAHLAQNFGAGVQACYRGPRLYDTEETRKTVEKWVRFYKEYREILDADLIHVRRADGRDLDCMLHVNPTGEPKGLAVIFNPLDQTVEKEMVLPLYYTGLDRLASVRIQGGDPNIYVLDRNHNIRLPIRVKPRSMIWCLIN